MEQNVRTITLLMIVIASIASSLSYTRAADNEVNRQFDAKLALYRGAQQIQHQRIAQATLDASLVDTVPRSRALAEVASAVSAGIRLTHISLDRETKAAAAARLLRIEGDALSEAQISQFVARLGKSRWLRGVNLSSRTDKSADEKAPRNFEVTAIFDGQRSK